MKTEKKEFREDCTILSGNNMHWKVVYGTEIVLKLPDIKSEEILEGLSPLITRHENTKRVTGLQFEGDGTFFLRLRADILEYDYSYNEGYTTANILAITAKDENSISKDLFLSIVLSCDYGGKNFRLSSINGTYLNIPFDVEGEESPIGLVGWIYRKDQAHVDYTIAVSREKNWRLDYYMYKKEHEYLNDSIENIQITIGNLGKPIDLAVGAGISIMLYLFNRNIAWIMVASATILYGFVKNLMVSRLEVELIKLKSHSFTRIYTNQNQRKSD
jgi:hypothetical protein